MEISGIHHITAIASDPQANVDFYTGVLGLRLVKLTVNSDDPGTYHLYYADRVGHPGTILTFLLWPGSAKGQRGCGQVTLVSFAIPSWAVEYWTERLAEHEVPFLGPSERFGEQVISLSDPDGLRIELISSTRASPGRAYKTGPVPAEYTIHGFHSATLCEEGYQRTASLLTETLGFKLAQHEGNRFRYAVGSGEPGAIVDVLCAPEEPPGHIAVGTVHHIAWQAADEQQLAWLKEIKRLNYNVTPVMDRTYYHSIYFREPGGILFEIATDQPGFSVDEATEELGSNLRLPPWLEPERTQIEAALPPLRLPAVAQVRVAVKNIDFAGRVAASNPVMMWEPASNGFHDGISWRVLTMKTCTHLDQIHQVAPRTSGCEECLKLGDSWVHLRLCLECGHVGCCDSSKNKHATKHFHHTSHPVMKSIEPGEDWGWCYVDQVELDFS